MRKRDSQNSNGTRPPKGRHCSSVEDWRGPRRKQLLAPARDGVNQSSSSKGSRVDWGTSNYTVTDNFNDRVPASARELDTIERYLGAEIDRLLRTCK